MIRIGFHECEECNPHNRTLIKIMKNGILHFKGSAHIGKGSKITVKKNAYLELGDNFAISASSAITCYKRIIFGKDIQFGWNCLVIDSDSHSIYDEKGELINPSKDVVFGDKIWIGSRTTVLKGTIVPSNCVIGACSLVSGENFEPSTLIVGVPAKSIKKIGGFKI